MCLQKHFVCYLRYNVTGVEEAHTSTHPPFMSRNRLLTLTTAVCGVILIVIALRNYGSFPVLQAKLQTWRWPYLQPSASHNSSRPEGQVVLPSPDAIRSLTYEKATALYHSYVDNLQTFCARMARLGTASDGGWEVCEDEVFRPRKPCLVYSFGINYDWSFDENIVSRYGCEVHAFDPSMKMPDHLHKTNIYFHNLGLASYNGTTQQSWPVKTLAAIRQQLGHLETPIDILKIDIELMEWSTLPEMLQSGAMDSVRQFLVEIHITLNGEASYDRYLSSLLALRTLYDKGFRMFFTHRNHNCPFTSTFGPQRISCNEIYTININADS